MKHSRRAGAAAKYEDLLKNRLRELYHQQNVFEYDHKVTDNLLITTPNRNLVLDRLHRILDATYIRSY